jgi:hypothetical protein
MHAEKKFMKLAVAAVAFVSVNSTTVIEPAFEAYCGRDPLPPFQPPDDGSSLISVNTFFRHAMRADYRRSSCFPNHKQTIYEPSIESEFALQFGTHLNGSSAVSNRLVKKYRSGFQVGQMLDYGKNQMMDLAQYLLSAYPQLISPSSIGSLYLRSTDVQRTLGSMSILLDAIAGDASSAQFAVGTDDFDYDPLNLNCQSCQRASDIYDQFQSSDSLTKFLNSKAYTDCASRWKSEIGTPFDTQSNDCLMAPYCARVPLPGNLVPSSELLQCVEDVSLRLRHLRYGFDPVDPWSDNGREFCNLATAPFMRDLYSNVKQNVSGLWATHDDTLTCMLTNLDMWDGQWPRYASFLSFEVYENGRVRLVRDGVELGWKESVEEMLSGEQRDEKVYEATCARSAGAEASVGWGGTLLSYSLRALGAMSLVGLVIYI